MDTPYWVPDQPLWERIKAAAGHRTIRVTVSGIASASTLISRGKTSFAVSEDPVDVPLGFLRKQLPFRKAKDAPQDSQMVVADIKSYGKPRVVLQDQPICFNCHAYSPDGKAYGMDMDYKGDKG